MSSLLSKLKKNSTVKKTEVLSQSEFFKELPPVDTGVPMMNVALSGEIDGGLKHGLTVLAGPSKHFKTSFALQMAAAYMKANPDAILLFYDSEFGSPQSYFETFGVDIDRVLHTPITDVEVLKFDIVAQLEAIEENEDVIIIIDSIGNLASKKELEDAKSMKSVADMSRAKALKGLFRMITPYLTMRRIPLLAINHTYDEIGLFPRKIVSGGTGIYYSADNIWIVGRSQNKKGGKIEGYDFKINIEKSRYVREKSKIPITVTWEGGIATHSGLLDIAVAGGYVLKGNAGWYERVNKDTGEILGKKFKEAATYTAEFWEPIFSATDFKEFVKSQFRIGEVPMIEDFEFTSEGE